MEHMTEFINQLIKQRRSVFPPQYDQEKHVDDAIISQMLENANWAPTHGRTEPWRFKVFTGKGLEKLANFQAALYKELTTANDTFQEAKYKKLQSKPLQASHIISIGVHPDPKGKIPEVEEIEAVACAVQNMYLTATAYGIGCYWGSGGITYKKEANHFFDLGPDDTLLGFLYAGIPAKPLPDGKRNPIADKISWCRE